VGWVPSNMPLADSASTAVALTTGQAILGALTALGVGAITASVITAITTSRREFKSWLRTQQVEANRKFHQSALALQTYVVTGPPREAVTTFDGQGLAVAINGVFEHLVDLHLRFQDLTEVARPKTHNVARTVCDIQPLLAWGRSPR
jgi:hypothetical protein